MAEWRARMLQQGKEATRWMKPQALPNRMLPADDSRATINQSLDGIRTYWRKIWHRQDVVPHLPSELAALEVVAGPQADWLPDASRIHQVARGAAGAAAGCDGWSGSEIYQ